MVGVEKGDHVAKRDNLLPWATVAFLVVYLCHEFILNFENIQETT